VSANASDGIRAVSVQGAAKLARFSRGAGTDSVLAHPAPVIRDWELKIRANAEA